MRVLVACERSGVVRDAFRLAGHDAMSCDLCPSESPGPHLVADAIQAIRLGWDLVIAHPPSTHLAISGARHFAAKRADGRQQAGVGFFRDVVAACSAYANAWAIENPVGIMSTEWRRPDQIIQPWQFGHPECKATCLWLGGLPALIPTLDVGEQMRRLPARMRNRCHYAAPGPDRWMVRSRTYRGIADAMASQWSSAVSVKSA